MFYYNDPKNVENYIKMCESYDSSNLYNLLKQHLKEASTLLELGCGAGLDMAVLKEHYKMTGSDLSDEFLHYCKNTFPDIPFLKLDISDINLKMKFDGIYSNKVLHHLSEEALIDSLEQQSKILSPNGIIAHSFWLGDESYGMNGLHYQYYNKERLLEIISHNFEVVALLQYEEFEPDDSLFVIARLSK
jgi:cyclopropane fatty-acyl-phospholipid synthase-like methyltransferase